MTKLSTNHSMISLLAIISTVSGCGVMPAGQASSRTFTVTGFILPVTMAYTDKPEISARIPGIAASNESAQGFVLRVVMQTIFDVLESQARSALLPDALISAILGQLEVKITYQPLLCQIVLSLGDATMLKHMESACIIADNTVTGICTNTDNAKQPQQCTTANMKVSIAGVPEAHLIIRGTLSTTNIIMANWSRAMWQNVVNRGVRMLSYGPFESHFFSATATVGGN